MAKKNKYRCIHCGKIVKRNSAKKWIASDCVTTDKKVHLLLIEDCKQHENSNKNEIS